MRREDEEPWDGKPTTDESFRRDRQIAAGDLNCHPTWKQVANFEKKKKNWKRLKL